MKQTNSSNESKPSEAELIEQEIKERQAPDFLPAEWRKWRLAGKTAAELDRDGDLTHVWR